MYLQLHRGRTWREEENGSAIGKDLFFHNDIDVATVANIHIRVSLSFELIAPSDS